MPARPAKTITCRQCGEQGRDDGHGRCNRCKLADPDWPFRYGASTAARLPDIRGWWQALTEFAAARHHPGGAVAILRQAGRVMLRPMPHAGAPADPDGATRPDGTLDAAGRALEGFFTSHWADDCRATRPAAAPPPGGSA